MIYNIKVGAFGGQLRAGDLIGVANVVEHMRKTDITTQFYLESDAVKQSDYCQIFYNFLLKNTDYFSPTPGDCDLPSRRINLFDFRDISGDLVKIHNTKEKKKKIVVFPLFDAPYNTYRNWPSHVFISILDSFNKDEYKDYEKIICSNKPFDIPDWKSSTDFLDNIHHIMETEVFVGGDTWSSHFAGSIDNGPKNLLYYYSSRSLIHALPFHYLNGKGNLKTYWLDFEGTTW